MDPPLNFWDFTPFRDYPGPCPIKSTLYAHGCVCVCGGNYLLYKTGSKMTL